MSDSSDSDLGDIFGDIDSPKQFERDWQLLGCILSKHHIVEELPGKLTQAKFDESNWVQSTLEVNLNNTTKRFELKLLWLGQPWIYAKNCYYPDEIVIPLSSETLIVKCEYEWKYKFHTKYSVVVNHTTIRNFEVDLNQYNVR